MCTVGLSLSHLPLASSKLNPSPNFHGYPTPRPYADGFKQYNQLSVNPEGHVGTHDVPLPSKLA